MSFYTKVSLSRQVKQISGTTADFSGSTNYRDNLSVYDASDQTIFLTTPPFPFLIYGPSAYTFNVGAYSHTSGTSYGVAITAFSAATGMTCALSIGQPPLPVSTGGTSTLGISASTLQIARGGLLPDGALGHSSVDLQIDEKGNVVRGTSSSLRYKYNFKEIEKDRYLPLLDLKQYFFNYKENGTPSFGLVAEEMDQLGLNELVVYDSKGRPDNIRYKLLSVSLLHLIRDLYKNGIKISDEVDNKTKVINSDVIGKIPSRTYETDGEYLLVVTESCKIKLNSNKDTKVKVKSLTSVVIIPDKGLIDNKWESISLDGDSCIELVFVDGISSWVIVSSDGMKDS